jgi:propanol-preferring alcohol dehydrogenase
MKAIRLTHIGRPLEAQEIDTPAVGPNDALVRVRAAGICHSDAHYRAGTSRVEPLPRTLGHEVAGEVTAVGAAVIGLKPGDRVCLHYMATCGQCPHCARGQEQFCETGQMIGKHRDGGYAEHIAMPARSVFGLPAEVPFAHGAILMCSSATSLHALRKARLQAGESVAVFGAGGLGLSAIQLAFALGALSVFAVDIQPAKLALAERFGAVPVDASASDPVAAIRQATRGRGVDVALELVGLPVTMSQAVRSLAIQGRAALAGITGRSFEVTPYHELINREAEVIGVSDHLAQELPLLIEFARLGKLDLAPVVTRAIPLDAAEINAALDDLERFGGAGRVVITP